MIIAFEGLDGAGKTTQVHHLEKHLCSVGHEVLVFQLNGNDHFKKLCRVLNENALIGPLEASLMKASDIAGRAECAMKPGLKRGAIVIWDKYVVGSIVADSARQVADEYLQAMVGGLPFADLTFYFDIDENSALIRKKNSGGPRIMESGLDHYLGLPLDKVVQRFRRGEIAAGVVEACFVQFQRRIREAYQRFLPADTTVVIDASRNELEIAADIREQIDVFLSCGRAEGTNVDKHSCAG